MPASREQDFITLARKHAKTLLETVNALDGLKVEWDALDYGTNLDEGAGANLGYTKQMVSDVVNTTLAAVKTLLAAGHSTNLAKLL